MLAVFMIRIGPCKVYISVWNKKYVLQYADAYFWKYITARFSCIFIYNYWHKKIYIWILKWDEFKIDWKTGCWWVLKDETGCTTHEYKFLSDLFFINRLEAVKYVYVVWCQSLRVILQIHTNSNRDILISTSPAMNINSVG